MHRRHSSDSHAVPSLQIAPLRAVAEAEGALLRLPGVGLRIGVAALLGVAAIATPVVILTQRSHASGRVGGYLAPQVVAPRIALSDLRRSSGRLAPTMIGPGSAVAAGGAHLIAAGAALAGQAGGGTVTAAGGQHGAAVTTSGQQPGVVARGLTLSQLTSASNGGGTYAPPAYLAQTYRVAARSSQIPWSLLAAIEYVQRGYADVVAGPSAQPLQAVAASTGQGREPLNAAVLARAVAAAGRPSAQLLADAQRLSAAGVAENASGAVSAYLHGSVSLGSGATGSSSVVGAASSVGSATGAGAASSMESGSQAADAPSVQAVLTLAQEIGNAGVAGSSPPTAKLAAMQNEASVLDGLPYVWGGGHQNSSWTVGSGYDCSGFVSAVLHAAGYLTSPDTTQTLPGSPGILNGPGKYVTLYDRTVATVKVWVKKQKIVTLKKAANPAAAGVHVVRRGQPGTPGSVTIRLPKWVGEWKTMKITKLVPTLDNSNNDEHVIIDLDGQWWESGGSSADGGSAMVHRILDPTPGYLKSFNQILHPSGL